MLGLKRLVLAIVVVLFSTVSASATATASAQASIIVGNTEVSWTGDWEYDPDSSMDRQATLTQVDAETGSIKLATYGEFMDSTVAGPSQALDVFADSFFTGAGATAITEAGSGDLEQGGVWKVYTFDLQGLKLTFLVTANQNSAGAFVVTTLTGNTERFASTIEQAQQEITLNGERAFFQGVDPVAVTASILIADSPSASDSSSMGSTGAASLPNSASRTTASSSDLEILSISMKDAGTGDGTIYVYVEVKNNTGKLYSYVGVDGTCRNASGGIIGTGLGNTMNVSPGETVVITMVIMNVPGCTDVDVRFDALTGMV